MNGSDYYSKLDVGKGPPTGRLKQLSVNSR